MTVIDDARWSTPAWVQASKRVLILVSAIAFPATAAAQMPVVDRTFVQGGYTVTGNDFMDCQSGGS